MYKKKKFGLQKVVIILYFALGVGGQTEINQFRKLSSVYLPNILSTKIAIIKKGAFHSLYIFSSKWTFFPFTRFLI